MSVIKELRERYDKLKEKKLNASVNRIKKLEAAYFQRFDKLLDEELNEPYWLGRQDIAEIVSGSIKYNDGKEYDLWAFTIMPNHVNSLLTLRDMSSPLYEILQHHKRYTARQANKLLNREGQFWEHETYDHLVRNSDEFSRILKYILNNPVKAGFVREWKDWKWNFVNPILFENCQCK